MKSRKSWSEKLADDKGLPRVSRITGKMAKRWGTGAMVIPAPREVDELMRKVPKGKLTTINELRTALAPDVRFAVVLGAALNPEDASRHQLPARSARSARPATGRRAWQPARRGRVADGFTNCHGESNDVVFHAGFDLEDFKQQIGQMKKMGGVAAMLDRLPGQLAQVAGNAQMDDKQMRRIEGIINSMTPVERSKPDLLKASRKRWLPFCNRSWVIGLSACNTAASLPSRISSCTST